MAHTDPENEQSIIPQKPPPPPRREENPAERPAVDPGTPTEPGQRHPVQTPIEQPPAQPIAPRVAHANGPGSGRRIGRKASGVHVLVPPPDLKEEIISRDAYRPRAGSAPDLLLLGFPARHNTPSRSSLQR